ncbi:unnamed protein product, partial [Rodentolepis nana]|uniref:DHC_N1 domain-containing protein n=1 Tax=Rodentolepis nana TaxID=102285 RepID=A0A0R3T8F7_RODNA
MASQLERKQTNLIDVYQDCSFNFRKQTRKFRDEKLQEFCDASPEKCRINLKLPLLKRDSGGLLDVNFEKQLVEILDEVRYLLMMSGEGACTNELPTEFEKNIVSTIEKLKEKLPQETIQLFERSDPIRQARLKLNQISSAYNTVRQRCYTVEYPLISTKMKNFEDALSPAFDQMNWENYDIEFIDKNLAVINDLRSRVLSAQENLRRIRDLASSWSTVPLYQGKEGKFDCLIPLKDQRLIKETRYREILNISDQILHIVAENLYLYNADPDSREWLAYQEVMEDAILEGLTEAVRCSLAYLADHTDKTTNDLPIMQGSLLIEGTQLQFKPAMHDTQGESLMDLMDNLVQDITDQSRLIPLLSSHPTLPDIKAERESKTEIINEEDNTPETESKTSSAHIDEDEKEIKTNKDTSISTEKDDSNKIVYSQISNDEILKTIKERKGFSQLVMQTPEIADLILKITDHVNA